jgi:uncharacterized membrane protein
MTCAGFLILPIVFFTLGVYSWILIFGVMSLPVVIAWIRERPREVKRRRAS